MDNGKDFMKSPEMIAMLEQLRHDIDADIERRKMAYIGKDGKDYYDKQDLDTANKAYIETMYKFIGRDGREYSTNAELEMANKMYQETMFPFIDKDGRGYSTNTELEMANQETIFSKMEKNNGSSYEDIESSRKMR